MWLKMCSHHKLDFIPLMEAEMSVWGGGLCEFLSAARHSESLHFIFHFNFC